jgi:predicted nucleic acid-binding protein
MTITATTCLFFDSSCLVAAAGSPTGGSSLLLAICARGFLKGAVSHAVLAEAEGNVLANLPLPARTRYHQEILAIPLIVAPAPGAAEQETAAAITGAKDAHVLAAALCVGAQYLLTLDKRLARRITQEEELSLHVLSPGEFITTKLPTHPAYRSIRPG